MAIREIVRLGHPALRTPAREVPTPIAAAAELQTLIDDMLETMAAARGVGLAAPQLGLDLQLFVYGLPPADDVEAPSIPSTVVVNPMLEPVPGELVYEWEGCLSIPDLRGLVPRHPAVRLHGLDRRGDSLDYVARGFEARVIQHEFDHLNGVVFIDRMHDLRSLAYGEEWDRYLADAADAVTDRI
jgi:peptide deformylase